MNILSIINDMPGVLVIFLAVVIAICSILLMVDFVMSIIYFFKGNKSKMLSQEFAGRVMENNGLTNATVRGGWFAIRFWNYSRKTKSLKLRKPFQYNRRNVSGMITASCDAYNAVLIENKDPKRWAVRFLGAFAPIVLLAGIFAAVGFFVAMGGNESLAYAGASIIMVAFVFLSSFLTIYGLKVLRDGVIEGFEKGVQKGQINQADLNTAKFWFKIKIWAAVATLILNTIELLIKIAEQAQKNKES